MDHFGITRKENEWQVDGFPNAIKVIRITGPKARRLADLVLHMTDLDFALECLEAINHQPGDSNVTRQALWRSAIVCFMKCFGRNGSRFSLDAKKVYRGDAAANDAFTFVKSLRSKHMVHDENSFAQCLPGAVLNRDGSDCKIAKIVCLGVIKDTLGQDTYSNLHLLCTRAREWVVTQFDALCAEMTVELERQTYDDLLANDSIIYTPPIASDIYTGRARA